MTTETRSQLFSGFVHLRQRRPERDGTPPARLLALTAALPGTFRLTVQPGGAAVEMLGEVREPSSSEEEKGSRTIWSRALSKAPACPSSGASRAGWSPAGGRRPCEVVFTPVHGSLRIESVLSSWDEIGPTEKEALAWFLCRAQGSLRFARCELTERQALAASQLAASDLEAGLPHAIAAVTAAVRLLGREMRVLLSAEEAEGYLRFFRLRE